MRLLIIEDEQLLCDAIAETLRLSGYAVDTAYTGAYGLELFLVETYDLLILDLNLPDMDGLDILREIRKENEELRILILTARSHLADRVRGLDLGANDYLIKPFEFEELEARIRSLLRRKFDTSPTVLRYGKLYMDSNSRKVYVDQKEIQLTRKETAILEYLLSNQGKTVSQEELMEHIYDSHMNSFGDSLRVHMHSLRKKLQAELNYNPILTKVGVGYYLA